ncbi:MAG: hypothetical protein HQL31_12110, partial [Planctomycetes bacterium]|nr:hypothetical protein [Planctomycetota bacterium]
SDSQSYSIDSYDRDEFPIFEVEDGSPLNVGLDIDNNGVNKFRVTLVSMQLLHPVDESYDPDMFTHRVHELNVSGSTIDVSDTERISTQLVDGNSATFTFYEAWARENGSLRRGPGLYMVRVEAMEPARTDTRLTTSAKKAQYTKESRVFFKIVNKYKPTAKAQFLLVDNTNRDPYLIRNYGGASSPSMNLRYFESALDNYQYTKGTVNVDASYRVYTNDAVASRWDQRLAVGDKFRIKNLSDDSWSDWFRVGSIASDGSYLTLSTDSVGANAFGAHIMLAGGLANFSGTNYIVQRSFSEGYATFSYNPASIASDRTLGSTVTLNGLATDWNKNNIVKVGDWFKFLDEGTYMRITGVGSTSLSLSEAYPADSLIIYHSTGDINSGHIIGGVVSPFRVDSTVSGSYAVYPADPDSSSEPLYLYKVWRTHNYNITNALGQGVHGDVTDGILSEYSGAYGHDRAVIWAHEVNFRSWSWSREDMLIDRNPLGVFPYAAVTQGYSNGDQFMLSDKDCTHLLGFLASGGRLLTGGQTLFNAYELPLNNDPSSVNSGSTFVTDTMKSLMEVMGVEIKDTVSGRSILKRIANDPISDVNNDTISFDMTSLSGGLTENKTETVDSEASQLGGYQSSLTTNKDNGVPFFAYDNDQYAAMRASGGDDDRPFATAFYGFDFSSISSSGARNIYSVSGEPSFYGRTLLLKVSLDWLRDPSRTVSDKHVKIFIKKIAELSVDAELPFQGEVNVSDFITSNGLASGVPINSDLVFEASLGTIYDFTDYTWSLTNDGTGAALTIDPLYSDNRRVTYRAGNKLGQDQLKLTAPDGAVVLLELNTSVPPVLLNVEVDGVFVVSEEINDIVTY